MKEIIFQFRILLILGVFSFSACQDGKMSGSARKATAAKAELPANGSAAGPGSENATAASPAGSTATDGAADEKNSSTATTETAGSNAGGNGSIANVGVCVGGKKVSLDGIGKKVNSRNESSLSTGSSLGQCNTSCHMQYSGHHGGSFNGRCGDSGCDVPGTKDDSQCQRCVYDEAC